MAVPLSVIAAPAQIWFGVAVAVTDVGILVVTATAALAARTVPHTLVADNV